MLDCMEIFFKLKSIKVSSYLRCKSYVICAFGQLQNIWYLFFFLQTCFYASYVHVYCSLFCYETTKRVSNLEYLIRISFMDSIVYDALVVFASLFWYFLPKKKTCSVTSLGIRSLQLSHIRHVVLTSAHIILTFDVFLNSFTWFHQFSIRVDSSLTSKFLENQKVSKFSANFV